MRIIYIEVAPELLKQVNGRKFHMNDPEPMQIELLEKPELAWDEYKDGPMSLVLLVATMKKYISVIERAMLKLAETCDERSLKVYHYRKEQAMLLLKDYENALAYAKNMQVAATN